MAILGATSLILMFLLCHALAKLYYSKKQVPPPPPIEENREEPEPIYYIVEKKTRKNKTSYGDPKQIKFD